MKKILILFLVFNCSCCVNKEFINSQNNQKQPDIYVINLDRMPERFNYVNEQLKHYDINAYRFSAIDVYKLEIKNVKTGHILNKDQKMNLKTYLKQNRYDKYEVSINGKPLLTLDPSKFLLSLGEIGCACSHRKIWEKVAVNNLNIIIFEDDIILSENFRNKLLSYIDDLPHDWDIAFLSIGRRHNKYGFFVCVGDIFRDIDNVNGHDLVAKIQKTNLVYGTYGYIINPKGAKKLLKLTNILSYPIDNIIFQNGGINTGIIKGYVSKAKMLEPKLNDSEIKRMGRSY